MIVATAGHIDHGKTALVRALTGMDTDRLPEEKARGISIDLGFAHCVVDGVTLGFIDVPGHERFVRNMLSGVYAVGHALLVVAADDGVMPQTREHLHILDLLDVDDGTLVITKADRVDAARAGQVEAQVRELVRGTRLQDAPALAVCALTGQGMAALRQRLIGAAAQRREACRASGDDAYARYVVDRAFTSAGSGTIVTGTVVAGSIAAGDMLSISPGGTEARVRKLQRHGEPVERAGAGERCALNLAGVELDDVARGDWLVAAAAQHPTDCLDVRLKVLAGEPGPLKHWTPVHVHIGAADVPARVALRRGGSIAPGASAMAQLRLARPLQAAHGDRMIIRDQSATRTIGGGAVVNPFPAQLTRSERESVLSALDGSDAAAAAEELVKVCADGLRIDWLARVYNLPSAAIESRLPTYATVVRVGAPRAFSDRHIAQLRQSIVERIGRFHAQDHELGGMELVQLHAELARSMPFDVFTALVKMVAQGAGLQLQGSRVGMTGHDSTDNARDQILWQRAQPVLMQAGAHIPSVRELAAALAVALPKLRDLLHRKSSLGQLVKLTQERFALPQTMQLLAQKARETAAAHDGLFSAAQYRDTIATGRGLAIEILECLDRQGVTQRKGDLRAIRPATAG